MMGHEVTIGNHTNMSVMSNLLFWYWQLLSLCKKCAKGWECCISHPITMHQNRQLEA